MAGNTPKQRLKTVLDRMVDMDHQEIPKDYVGLHYGGKGTRKTVTSMGLAQKLRGDGRILFVDSSDGWVSLDNFPALKRATDYVRVDDPAELMVIARALLNRVKGFEDISVVMLDEISSWYNDALNGYIREVHGVDEDQPLPKADWNDYGPPQAAIFNAIKTFHKVPDLHLIMISHEQSRAIKGDKNAERIEPALGSKLSQNIGQIAHVVARFESRLVRNQETKKQEYTTEIQVQPTRYVDAKTRIGGMPLKLDAVPFVKDVAAWVNDTERMVSDTAAAEAQVASEDLDEDDEDFEVGDDED